MNQVSATFLCLVVLVSMVSVSAQEMKRREAGVVRITAQAEGKRKIGTGFIVQLARDAAYIVTASHVVEGDNHPQVEFSPRRRMLVAASVVGLEGGDQRGLALLVVRGESNLPAGLSALCLAPSIPLELGDDVFVIGFPRRVESMSVVKGNIVARKGRDIFFSGAIDEGNSGGPMLKEGQVVGLVTEESAPYAQAIPAAMVQVFAEGWGVKPCVERPAVDAKPWVAEQTRAAMLKERQEAEQAGARQRAGLLWEAAERKAQEGEEAFRRRDYALAEQRAEEARQAYQQAALTAKRADEAVQRPQIPKVGDSRSEIHALLDTYKRALENLDPALYRDVRPDVSEPEFRKLKASFEYTRSHALDLTVDSINMSADEAEVKGRQKGVYISKDGQRNPYEKAVTFKLKRAPKGWVIVSIK
jgi:Trypsin-like peptidase domain